MAWGNDWILCCREWLDSKQAPCYNVILNYDNNSNHQNQGRSEEEARWFYLSGSIALELLAAIGDQGLQHGVGAGGDIRKCEWFWVAQAWMKRQRCRPCFFIERRKSLFATRTKERDGAESYPWNEGSWKMILSDSRTATVIGGSRALGERKDKKRKMKGGWVGSKREERGKKSGRLQSG